MSEVIGILELFMMCIFPIIVCLVFFSVSLHSKRNDAWDILDDCKRCYLSSLSIGLIFSVGFFIVTIFFQSFQVLQLLGLFFGISVFLIWYSYMFTLVGKGMKIVLPNDHSMKNEMELLFRCLAWFCIIICGFMGVMKKDVRRVFIITGILYHVGLLLLIILAYMNRNRKM